MKKFFKYIENIWIGKDKKPSVRRVLGIVFAIDLVINFHKAGSVVTNVIKLLYTDIILDAQVLSATSSFLANIAMIIGIEAGLVAALFSLTTYQNIQSIKNDTLLTSNDENNIIPGQLPT